MGRKICVCVGRWALTSNVKGKTRVERVKCRRYESKES